MAKKDIETEKEERDLAVDLTDAEIKVYAGEIAEALTELGRINQRRKNANAAFKAEAEEQQTVIDEKREALVTGQEDRTVTCTRTIDTARLWITVTRDDTGETVEDRPLTEAEKQTEIQ